MTFIENDLGCDIFWCTAESPGFAALGDHFRKAKINHFGVAVIVQEQIFRFQVSVNNALTMQIIWKKVGIEEIEKYENVQFRYLIFNLETWNKKSHFQYLIYWTYFVKNPSWFSKLV